MRFHSEKLQSVNAARAVVYERLDSSTGEWEIVKTHLDDGRDIRHIWANCKELSENSKNGNAHIRARLVTYITIGDGIIYESPAENGGEKKSLSNFFKTKN